MKARPIDIMISEMVSWLDSQAMERPTSQTAARASGDGGVAGECMALAACSTRRGGIAIWGWRYPGFTCSPMTT